MIEPWLMHAGHDVLAAFGPQPEGRPDAVVVDWEWHGKHRRQADAPHLLGTDTTIRPDDDAAVAGARAHGFERVVCRIQPVGAGTRDELARVRAQGGHAVLVPMWRSLAEVTAVLEAADGLEVGVMVETTEAVAHSASLAGMGVAFAFVGLVDLAIDRRTTSIFAPLADGTLDTVAERLAGVPLGFGGLTLPHLGAPIPNRLIVGELARLGAAFSVMRRSFLSDVGRADLSDAIVTIRAALDRAERRTADEVDADRRELLRVLQGMRHA